MVELCYTNKQWLGVLHFEVIVNMKYHEDGFEESSYNQWAPTSALPKELTIPHGPIEYQIECIVQLFIKKGGDTWQDTFECECRVKVPFIGDHINFDYTLTSIIEQDK